MRTAFTIPEYESAATDLIAQMEAAAYVPDSIVNIPRGGSWLAAQLSNYFESVHGSTGYGVVRASHYDGKERKDDVITERPLLDGVHGDVLVVDDIADSGKTLERVVALVNDYDLAPVKTATLHKRYSTTFSPDFYAHEVEDDAWIEYPWEHYK